MPRINLLPWREELRAKRKKEFLLAAVGAVLVGVALTFGTKVFYQTKISNQESRNNLLRTEIAELDRQIAEINELDAQKARLLARMEIIEQLQRSRPEAVHLVDEAINILPEGTHMTLLQQEGATIRFDGIAQSSTRVSAMMRNVDQSDWLKDPRLEVIEYAPNSGPRKEGEFRLFSNQVSMSDEEEVL